MTRRYQILLLLGVLLATLLVAGAWRLGSTAYADTPGCVSHAEFDSMDRLLSTTQVAGRFDTAGWYIGSGTDFWRRGYDACWSSTEQVVVWYSLVNGLSDHWAVRAV